MAAPSCTDARNSVHATSAGRPRCLTFLGSGGRNSRQSGSATAWRQDRGREGVVTVTSVRATAAQGRGGERRPG